MGSGSARDSWESVEVTIAVAAKGHLPKVEILNGETQSVKFNRTMEVTMRGYRVEGERVLSHSQHGAEGRGRRGRAAHGGCTAGKESVHASQEVNACQGGARQKEQLGGVLALREQSRGARTSQ